MELEEAVKILQETQDSYLKDELDLAIEAVLQALESYKERYELAIEQNIKDYKNSIPKKKIEKLIDDLYGDDNTIYGTIRIIEMLQELLEDK